MKLNIAKRKNSELRSSTVCRPENGRSDQIKNLPFSGPHTSIYCNFAGYIKKLAFKYPLFITGWKTI